MSLNLFFVLKCCCLIVFTYSNFTFDACSSLIVISSSNLSFIVEESLFGSRNDNGCDAFIFSATFLIVALNLLWRAQLGKMLFEFKFLLRVVL